MKRLISLILSVILICMIACGCSKAVPIPNMVAGELNYEAPGLKVHFIDVGQGDSVLLESYGRFALVDGGEYSERDKVMSYLSDAGVESLDYIFCTHPHSDHCGGLSEVIRNYKPELFISPVADSDSDAWTHVLDAADERDVTYETPNVNSKYLLGEATITVLSPSINSLYKDLNNYSIVCMVEFHDSTVLLTGDAEQIIEEELVRNSADISADILKCGHHGSSTSSCESFLDEVDPSVAIISCGEGNEYGHPHDETITALKNRNILTYRTDIDGSIVAEFTGKEIIITNSVGETKVVEPKVPYVAAATSPSGSQSQPATSAPSTSTAAQAASSITPAAATYIGNKNSKVFHYPDCDSVEAMNDSNKISLASREDATNGGYKPCQNCNP